MTTENKPQNTNEKPKGLLLKLIGTAAVAASLTVFVYLPAERGIDPTGVGKLLGLTKMGEIKSDLLEEAAADKAAHSSQTHVHSDGTVHANGDDHAGHNHGPGEVAIIKQSENPEGAAATLVKSPGDEGYRDKFEYTLKPGEAVEVKLVMEKNGVTNFVWTANGGALNYNTHGHASGKNITYEKGTNTPEQTGQLTAAFPGMHGWFWRNRTEEVVVITLQTDGEYSRAILP